MKKPLTPAAFPLSESVELEARCAAERAKVAAKKKLRRALAGLGCTALLALGGMAAWAGRTVAPAATPALPEKHLCYGGSVWGATGGHELQREVVRGLSEQECNEWQAKQAKENDDNGIFVDRIDPPAHATTVCWDPCPSWVSKHVYD